MNFFGPNAQTPSIMIKPSGGEGEGGVEDARFTVVPLKPYSNVKCGRYCRL